MAKPGFIFLGGEMEDGRKFVGMQDLTFNVDLRQVWGSSTNTLGYLSNVKGSPQLDLSCIWTNVPTFSVT